MWEVVEPKDWTEDERRDFMALVGRGVITVLRTMPDGRAVFQLSKEAARKMGYAV